MSYDNFMTCLTTCLTTMFVNRGSGSMDGCDTDCSIVLA